MRKNQYPIWDYQRIGQIGIGRYDIVKCHNRAVEIIRESRNEIAWKHAEMYLPKISQGLGNPATNKDLDDDLANIYYINAGRTLN